jgi:hypothetical protein
MACMVGTKRAKNKRIRAAFGLTTSTEVSAL